MNIFPLINKEQQKREREKINNMKIQLPSEWWTSNYSFNLMVEKKTNIYNIGIRQLNKIPPTPGWNVKKGDYRVKESKIKTQDYIYNRNLKLKIIKYSIYLVIIVTIYLVAKISEYLSHI